MYNFVLSPIDPDRLISEISEKVAAMLLKELRSNNDETSLAFQIIDGDDLCRKLGITRQTLSRWRRENRIPFIQQGGVIRYDLNKVVSALENRKKKGVYNV